MLIWCPHHDHRYQFQEKGIFHTHSIVHDLHKRGENVLLNCMKFGEKGCLPSVYKIIQTDKIKIPHS